MRRTSSRRRTADPRFVEDCVREMIRGAVDRFPELPGSVFLSARQENLETIHQHNVVAERFGTLTEIREELSGQRTSSSAHTSRRAWLDSTPWQLMPQIRRPTRPRRVRACH